MEIRHDWARDEIRHIYHLPVPDLIFQAQLAHRAFHKADEIQICRLLSIKTGGCPEDCAYCSQRAHYESRVEARSRLRRLSPTARHAPHLRRAPNARLLDADHTHKITRQHVEGPLHL